HRGAQRFGAGTRLGRGAGRDAGALPCRGRTARDDGAPRAGSPCRRRRRWLARRPVRRRRGRRYRSDRGRRTEDRRRLDDVGGPHAAASASQAGHGAAEERPLEAHPDDTGTAAVTAELQEATMHVHEFMTTPAVTVRTTTSIADVGRLLLRRDITAAPVVDR